MTSSGLWVAQLETAGGSLTAGLPLGCFEGSREG
jgi:hypothetical protein